MITLSRITDCHTPEYRFAERLITASFPYEEYRDLAELREFTAGKRQFHNNLVRDAGKMVGIVTYWDFGKFHYVEHFAVLPSMRGKGYRKEVLTLLRDTIPTPVVLEVELPVDGVSRRRIRFYERCGFRLWSREYLQPPYRPGGDFLPMYLMVYGGMGGEKDLGIVRKRIYGEVYGCRDLI